MIMPTFQVREILAAGGNLVLDGSKLTFNDLTQFASEASYSGASITIRNAFNLTHEHMKKIASIAPGLIVFDLT
jgi:hypothetical protein